MSGKGHNPWEALTRAREAERAADAAKEKEGWLAGLAAKMMIAAAISLLAILATGYIIGSPERSYRRRSLARVTSVEDRDRRNTSIADRMAPEKRRWLFIGVGALAFLGTLGWLSRPVEDDLKEMGND